MPMKNPPHPGRALKYDCIEPLGLTVTEAARILGVARPTLSNIIHGKAGLSPEMASRLEKAFGGTADAWLRMQAAHDLAKARRREKQIKVKRYVAA